MKGQRKVNTTKGPAISGEGIPEIPTVEEVMPVAEAVPVEEALPVEEVSAPELRSTKMRDSEDDMVRISMLETLEPPPTVGKWSGAEALHVTRMTVRESYTVPRFVAQHLEDKKKCIAAG